MAETLYEAIGGADGCRKLAAAFYARVEGDPLLRPFFPGSTFKCAIEEFSAFLVQFLGGPAEESQRRWWVSLRESHARFRIDGEHRDAWMRLMVRALDDVKIAETARTALRGFFEESSRYVVGAPVDPKAMDEELAGPWRVQQTLDEAIAAIRSGNADRAIALADMIPVNTGLLAAMIGGGQDSLIEYVRDTIVRDPWLIQERYAGRTLLHVAAARGSSGLVELLLDLGADPNSRDGGGHTPLYSLGNECGVSGSGKIVGILVARGALVDAADGVKHCTPLHMAARRGNTEIAEALLDAGAGLEVRDSLGHTPLRRAVNCNKAEVAALLLRRGADRRSRCGKGMTPLFAARGSAMKQLLMQD